MSFLVKGPSKAIPQIPIQKPANRDAGRNDISEVFSAKLFGNETWNVAPSAFSHKLNTVLDVKHCTVSSITQRALSH